MQRGSSCPKHTFSSSGRQWEHFDSRCCLTEVEASSENPWGAGQSPSESQMCVRLSNSREGLYEKDDVVG